MQMTMAEKREFLERMQELVKNNILRKEDRDAVYRICLAACGRELEELKREGGYGFYELARFR